LCITAFLVKALAKCRAIFTRFKHKKEQLEETNEYSVFSELPEPKPPRPRNGYQRYVYFAFVAWFVVQGGLRWVYFITFRGRNVANGQDAINTATLPYLISAITITTILITSLILFFRKSMRASIALLIFGAVLELVIFYFMRPY
jgi:hypothetical protein